MNNNLTKKLAGKVAVVTGASKGIGASIAKHLAAEGASVVVNYASSKAGADKVVSEITAQGGKALAVQGDVAKRSDIERLFAETRRAFGRLDVLVNNAGVYEFLPLEQITEEHFHKQFDLNVLGLILTTQEAVKQFGSTGGSIINISSGAGLGPSLTGIQAYCSAKHAVVGLTRQLAHELGPFGITVNSVAPGFVRSNAASERQWAGYGEEGQKALVERIAMKRLGSAQDIVNAVVFFASELAGFVNGQVLAVDGGK